MSLLIKGMDMPKSCADCFFRQAAPNSLDVYFCYADKNNRYAVHDKRPLFCPLVEVPMPHGDLIDRDKFIDRQNQIIKECCIDGVKIIAEAVRDTLLEVPTIIEAEE